MRRLFFMSFICLLSVCLRAETAREVLPVTPEAEARLSAEALARYSAPGEPARYLELLKQLNTPGDTLGAPAKRLRLPVKSWPDGRPQTMVYAEEAWVSATMQSLRGRKVRVEHYREDGELEAVLEADEIVVDRETKLAAAKGRITGAFSGDQLSGRGALIDLDAQYVRILSRACIITRRTGDVDLTSRGMF